MLHHLLIGYIVLYVIVAIGLFALHSLIVPVEDKKDDKRWETPLDLLLVLTGLAGMLFLLIGIQPHGLKVAWRPISVSLFLLQILLCVKDRIRFSRSAEATSEKRA